MVKCFKSVSVPKNIKTNLYIHVCMYVCVCMYVYHHQEINIFHKIYYIIIYTVCIHYMAELAMWSIR